MDLFTQDMSNKQFFIDRLLELGKIFNFEEICDQRLKELPGDFILGILRVDLWSHNI